MARNYSRKPGPHDVQLPFAHADSDIAVGGNPESVPASPRTEHEELVAKLGAVMCGDCLTVGPCAHTPTARRGKLT